MDVFYYEKIKKEGGNLPRTKQQTTGKTPANKQKGGKVCTCCHVSKKITDFYFSSSPMYSLDERIPVCKECCKSSVLTEEGKIDFDKFKDLLRNIDKPLYFDLLFSSEESVKKENSYLSDEEVALHGYEILQKYFTLVVMRQDKSRSYSDSEKEGFIHQNSNRTKKEKEEILNRYSDLINQYLNNPNTSTKPKIQVNNFNLSSQEESEELIYDDKWMGKYTQKDIDYLNKYYVGLERDYKIITENHRDYARKIAKASLQMDKAFDEMINGIDGADARYKNAREAFDTLSKSAKFSESTRSVNDVGISSFSKVAAMVEVHNWIPEHKPLKKDTIDEMIDYLSTITKSL